VIVNALRSKDVVPYLLDHASIKYSNHEGCYSTTDYGGLDDHAADAADDIMPLLSLARSGANKRERDGLRRAEKEQLSCVGLCLALCDTTYTVSNIDAPTS